MARTLSVRERLLVLAAVAMLVVYLGVRPFIGRLADVGPRSSKLLAEKTRVIAAYRQAVGRENILTAESAALEAQIDAYEAVLLPGATPPLAAADLQIRIKQLADRAGLKIQSEKILPHVKGGAYLEIPVQIVFNGEIRHLKDFLLAVEASPVFIAVPEVNLRAVKRRQPAADARGSLEAYDIQASLTFVGLIHGGPT